MPPKYSDQYVPNVRTKLEISLNYKNSIILAIPDEVCLPEDSNFKTFIKDINEELNRYDHDIAFIKYPISKEEFLVFRTMNSKVIRFLNNLSEQDRNYFRLLLTTIASSDEYGIPDIRAINLSTMLPDKPLAKNRAEDLLQNWKQVGYFYQSDNTLFFGPRMMVEFESLLLTSFPDDVKECSLCKTIVLWVSSIFNFLTFKLNFGVLAGSIVQ